MWKQNVTLTDESDLSAALEKYYICLDYERTSESVMREKKNQQFCLYSVHTTLKDIILS
jgi:hypothetical protein